MASQRVDLTPVPCVSAGSPSRQSISEWRMQSIARDSEDSTDDEFFDAHGKQSPPPVTVVIPAPVAVGEMKAVPAEDFSDSEEIFVKDITKWSSNDLMDKIETIEVDEAQGRTGLVSHPSLPGSE